ncbi:M24 family metallopeptidase [Bradyrhizobium elkanii]
MERGCLPQGSQINIELSGHRHNYVVPIMRTFSIGVPSDRLRRFHEAEVSAMDAALNAARPRLGARRLLPGWPNSGCPGSFVAAPALP